MRDNTLSTVHPSLAREWHPTKNGTVTPKDVAPKSNKKVWWQCSVDPQHEWEAVIANRSKANGTGCPYCIGQRPVTGVNDLQTLRPDIAQQWHPSKNGSLQPNQVTLKSRRKVWWQCPVNAAHEWEAHVHNITRYDASSGCPYCSRRVLLPGETDLATLSPAVAAQWHPTRNGALTAQDVAPGSDVKVWWLCSKGHEWETWVYARSSRNCRRCAASTSRGEDELFSAVQLLLPGVEVLRSDRSVLDGREVDIYIPSLNIALEFNGLYWHSEAHKPKNYHAVKHQECRDRGIDLYQVWEDDWRDRREIVLRGLAHKLGANNRLHKVLPDLPALYLESVGARSCSVVTVTYKEAHEFLIKNHIQGGVVGSMYLGLRDAGGRLRAILVIAKSGTRTAGEYSIKRYATAGNVQGGFSKLLKHAERVLGGLLKRWVTFADLTFSQGALYDAHGFIVDKIIPPDYSYFVRDSRTPQGRREHKFNYRLKRFREDRGLYYKEGLTERQLAAANGLVRVYDAGKVRYIKNITNSIKYPRIQSLI